MPTLKFTQPAYRLHATGQAVVTLNGVDHYLGRHGTPASHRAYDRLVGLWILNGRRPLDPRNTQASVNEVLLAYWKHVKAYYVKDGKPTSERATIKAALKLLRRHYGASPVAEFGPKALTLVRAAMVQKGWSRPYVNKQPARLRQMFAWCNEQ